MTPELISTSRFISLVLRHRPQMIGLALDEAGWADVDELIAKSAARGRGITRQMIATIMREGDKQRFALSEDGKRIRANHGHSINIDLGLAPTQPPAVLYHGTAATFLASIRQHGLVAKQRQYVHLSADKETALLVGARHGEQVVLEVNAARMWLAGILFYTSASGIWLVEGVAAEYLKIQL